MQLLDKSSTTCLYNDPGKHRCGYSVLRYWVSVTACVDDFVFLSDGLL